MESPIADPNVVAFLVSYGASVTWDGTKAGIKGLMSLFRRPEGRELATLFEGLRQEDQLKRSSQHLINSILKNLPDEQRESVAGDAERLTHLVLSFLTEPQAGNPPLTGQLRAAILEHTELPDGTDDATIASFTASVVIAVANDDIADAVLLAAVEQIQSTVNMGFERQAATANALGSMLFAEMQDVKQRVRSSFCQPVPDSDAAAKQLVNHLSDSAALLKHIGIQIPDSTYVDTKAVFAPPRLPQGYVRRQTVCERIERLLQQRPILAVTGYPECGKTLALAEFASKTQECFWLDFPTTLSTGIQAMRLLDLALSNYLESGPMSADEIVTALSERLATTPLLIVLDNVERLDDVDLLQPLLTLAEETNGRLRILMAYAEMPDFTAAAKLARVPTWRLPGMEPHEAAGLYQALGIVITKPRLIAATMLCAQYEGHVGMLRLFHEDIAAIQTNTDAASVLADAPRKTTAADFLEALSLRFMKSVSSDVLTLCRRVSLAIAPFRRSLAAALWAIAGDEGVFPVVWKQCKVGVFEHVAEDRFRVPFLYSTSLRRDIEDDEVRKLHKVAADVLFMPPDRAMTVDDAFSCVFHYISAGQPEAALRAALALLTNAMMAERMDILRVLYGRFALVITDDFLRRNVSAESHIFWQMLSAAVANRCGDVSHVEACVLQLAALLEEHEETISDQALWYGRRAMLVFAAISGLPDLAWTAFDGLRTGFMLEAEGKDTGSPLTPLFYAYLGSSRNVTEFVSNVFRRAQSGQLTSEQLWDGGRCWELWRGVGAELYSTIERLHKKDAGEAQVAGDELWRDVEKGLSMALKEMAVVLGATVAIIDIDIFRDMTRAVSRSKTLLRNGESLSPRVRSLALMTCGDALRCAEDVELAETTYRNALAAWPLSDSIDRAKTQNSLAVTVARLGRPDEGLWLGRLAARLLRRGRQEYQHTALARIHMECAVMAIHASRLPQALVSLARAHRVLREHRPNFLEWPALAQVAMSIDRAAESEATLKDIPVPGFTFGLPAVMSGAEELLPSAPDVMVARACEALGFHRKALYYCELSYKEVEDEGLRGMVAVMMYRSARLSQDLEATVQSAVRVFCAPATSFPGNTSSQRDQFLRGVLDSTVALATELAEEDAAVPALEAAREVVRSAPVDKQGYVATVQAAINGLLEARSLGQDDALAAAYQRAIDVKTHNAARNLAWYWCFRFLTARQVSRRDLFVWQWRLVWLTRLTAGSDSQFMAVSLEQQRAFWSRVRTAEDQVSVENIVLTIKQSAVPPQQAWHGLESELARCAYAALGYSGFLPELASMLASGIDVPWLDGIRGKSTAQLLDTILSPIASDVSDEIDSILNLIREIIKCASGTAQETAQDWLAEVAHLSTIHGQVQLGGLNNDGIQSLLALRSYEPSLSSHSHANWFFSLGQVAHTTDVRDNYVFDTVMPLLSSVVIGEFLNVADDLPASFAVRLRLLGLKTDSHCALRDFHESLNSVAIQQYSVGPITRQAVADANSRLRSSQKCAKDVAAAFGELKDDARSLGEQDADVVWACQYSRAQLVMALALPALRYRLCDSAEMIEQLEVAGREMLEALECAVKRKDYQGAAFAAAELATKACVLGEGEKEAEYCAAAMQNAEASLDATLVQAIESQLILRQQWVEPQPQAQWTQIVPEQDIAAFTDTMMQAHGWPEDRRRHVEDDVRKLNQAAIANRDFCKHLQPLQNLGHTRSQATIYTRPTTYTCSCTLLGHKTQIECDDMNAVINAMRRTYCDECKDRQPGRSEDT